MLYLVVKAFHIVFMVSYFAGIFYLVRLFVYYKDTDTFDDPKQNILREQYVFMSRRLWNIIIIPAGLIMLLTGVTMIFLNSALLKMPWFHLKLTFLLGLAAYHMWCLRKVKLLTALAGKSVDIPNVKLRMANEVATFILFLVVFTVVLKNTATENWWQLILGFAVLVASILTTVKLVNRKKKNSSQ